MSDVREVTNRHEVREFTAEQLDALDISKRHLDACIVAGPGSGKTTVLVEYFRRLVGSGVDPLRILAITFTEKAAGNMRTKLGDKFQSDPPLRAKLERAWVHTVHGFCSRLLRENAVAAGVDPEFKVSDARQSYRLQRDSIDAAMDEAFAADAPAVRALIRSLSSPDFEEAVLSVYDAIRGAGQSIDQVAAQPAPQADTHGGLEALLGQLLQDPLTGWEPARKEYLRGVLACAVRVISTGSPSEALMELGRFSLDLNNCKRGSATNKLLKELRDVKLEAHKYALITAHHKPQRALLFDILRRFDRIYRDSKRRSGLLDFADLEEFAVRLLADNPETRADVQSQFDHVLMDEFQDTNGQQAELLRLVRQPGRFYAVGDINQSIFGFRHAEPRGFERYREEIESSGAHLVNLAGNFRSRSEILSVIETVTHGREGIEPRSLVPRRDFPKTRPAAVEAFGVSGDTISAAERIEAQSIARRILSLLDEDPPYSFKDVAVLVRNTSSFTELAAAFNEARIPYLINSGRGFYESREVNDLVHLLRVISNPRDEVSFAAVLRSPLVDASDEALLRLRLFGDNIGGALFRLTPETAADFGADYLKLTRFREQLHSWRILRESVTFDRLLLSAIDDCGYRAESGTAGAANIDNLLAQAREAASRMTLAQFVDDLERVRELNPREADTAPEDGADSVKVMTVHAAKGLEFPIVFVAAMHKGVDAKLGVLSFSPAIGLGAQWRYAGKRDGESDLFQKTIGDVRKRRELEESHRLLYVAMSRAEEHLVLSFAGSKSAKSTKPRHWAKVIAETLPVVTIDRAPDLRLNTRPSAQSEDAVESLPAPSIDGQQDANATVTALSAFARCPRQYYLAHYLGYEGRRRKLRLDDDDADPDKPLPAGEFGTEVHDLLAGKPVDAPARDAIRLAEVFRQSPLGRRAAAATRIEREFDFLMSIDDLVIRGQIDLWFEEGGEVILVDYKTDALTPAEARQRSDDYSLQLRLYALAIERAAGCAPAQAPPIRAWLHFLRPDRAIEIDLTPSLIESPEQIVRDFQDAQSTLNFPMRIAEHCRRCPFYRDLCPAE